MVYKITFKCSKINILRNLHFSFEVFDLAQKTFYPFSTLKALRLSEGRSYIQIKRTIQYFYFSDMCIKGADVLGFYKGENLTKGDLI